MNDLEKQDEYPSTSTLSRQGLTAVGCTAGGLLLLILLPFALRFSLIIGGIACVFSTLLLLSKDTDDKKIGTFMGIAGVLTLLSKLPLVGPVAGTLIGIGGFGLLAFGIWNAIKFFIGLKKRS